MTGVAEASLDTPLKRLRLLGTNGMPVEFMELST